MSLFKNKKIIGLGLAVMLLGQITVQAAEQPVVVVDNKKITLFDQLKYGLNMTSHYSVRILAGAGAALGIYLYAKNAGNNVFIHTEEAAQVAAVGAVAGLGLGYVTRGQVNDLRQAYKNREQLNAAQQELAELKPRLAQAEKAELDIKETKNALAALQNSSQLAAQEAAKQTASLERARLQAEQHAQAARNETDQIKLGIAYLGNGLVTTGSVLLQAAVFQAKATLRSVPESDSFYKEGQQALVQLESTLAGVHALQQNTTTQKLGE